MLGEFCDGSTSRTAGFSASPLKHALTLRLIRSALVTIAATSWLIASSAHAASVGPVAGAASSTYTLRASDVGNAIRAVSTATNPDGQASVGSAPTARVAPAVVLPPVIGSTTTLLASPGTAVTNEAVTMIATVASAVSVMARSGAVAFEDRGRPIPGCSDVPVSPAAPSVTVACQASFPASNALLEAVFNPKAGSMIGGSRSPVENLGVSPASSVISVDASSAVNIGKSTTYTATVTAPPGEPGPVTPTGAVDFLDGGQPIGPCLHQQLTNAGATCTVTYKTRGTHAISARYLGDANFTAAISPVAVVTAVPPPPHLLGIVTATMQWTFYYTPLYTEIRALVVSGASGASVRVTCTGKGCPFANQLAPAKSSKRCGSSAISSCQSRGRVDLTPAFRNRHLMVGARMTVTIARPEWIGKVYSFTVRAGKAPRVQITCLQPDKLRAGAGC